MSTTEPQIDWKAIEQSPEFKELIAARRRFVLPATIFFLAWYIGFILLAGYAPDFMAESVYEGLTVGYCLALTQFVMVFVLGYTVPAPRRTRSTTRSPRRSSSRRSAPALRRRPPLRRRRPEAAR